MGSSSYPTISFILLYNSTLFCPQRDWDLGNQRHWVTELSSIFQVPDITQSPKSQEMQLQTQDLEMGSVVFRGKSFMEYPREENSPKCGKIPQPTVLSHRHVAGSLPLEISKEMAAPSLLEQPGLPTGTRIGSLWREKEQSQVR